MLDTLHDLMWKSNKFLYLHNMGKQRKLYAQKVITQKVEEVEALDLNEVYLSFIVRAKEFLVWAKENEEVPSVWSRISLAIYVIFLRVDVLISKLLYLYVFDGYDKVHVRNAIADLMYQCKAEPYKDLQISKVKLSYLEGLYKWLCENQ